MRRPNFAAIAAGAHYQLLDRRTVVIPAREDHEGYHVVAVCLVWECPVCLGPRGAPSKVQSWDGSRVAWVDGWRNPCGHVDKYSAVRREAGLPEL